MHLPIGVSDFRELIECKDPEKAGYLYVDKTIFIKEIIYDLIKVIVLTRPRRFGKTLNLSMLRYFFSKEVDGQSTKGLFDKLEIVKDLKCMEYQGKYPVVFISFKDVKQPNFELCLEKIGSIVALAYRQHRNALESDQMSEDDKAYIKAILNENTSRIQLESAIKRLLEFLFKYHKEKPILLIDEYDTPIQEAYLNDYYEELIPFFRNFLSGPLKDDALLKRGILTGILRISKESLFSGLSNVKIYSILSKQYSNYFGFTEDETNELLKKANLLSNTKETKLWFNGYNFGGATIYNPWSIMEFIKENGQVGPYWINTSGNYLIKELLTNSNAEIQDKVGQLIIGNIIKEPVDEHIVFQDLNSNRSAVWSLFLMSGYLKVISSNFTEYGNVCELAIPNKEVEFLYRQIFREWISGSRGIVWYQEFLNALINGEIEKFEHELQKVIVETASYHDISKKIPEKFYQGVMLGLLVGIKDTHEIKSNREAGNGRYDLFIVPKDTNKLGIIMEFKAIKNVAQLEVAAKEALEQINNSNYSAEFISRGIINICQMGISFSGKSIKIIATKR
jgi:hypothetical protein